MKNSISEGCAILALVVAAPAMAQSEAEPAQPTAPQMPDPCVGDAYRAFDFWIGEWEIRTPDGQQAGTNVIEPINRGCAILERYSVGGELYGRSYSYYDPVRETWSQLWLSTGVIIRMEGPISADGVLTLHGTVTDRTHDAPQAFVGRWSPRDDGTILQEFWAQNPETGEWTNGFTGIYTRTR